VEALLNEGDTGGTGGASPIQSGAAASLPSFVRHLLLFWSPIIALAALLETMFQVTAESWPMARVAAYQQRNPRSIFLRGYIDQDFYGYRSRNLAERRPRIVALGSSRVMQFRATMFGADSAAFYNAGGMIQNLQDLQAAAHLLPDSALPAVVFLGVDMWWLNESVPATPGLQQVLEGNHAPAWQLRLAAARRMARQPAEAARVLAAAIASPVEGAIGIAARAKGTGFRQDGSYDYNLPIPRDSAGWQFVDRADPPLAPRIRNGTHRFERTAGISARRLDSLRSAVAQLTRRGVLVAGFLPPLASEASALMEAVDGQRRLWREYRTAVPAIFGSMNLPFVDASTPQALGLDDRYMLDGFHAGETFHLHLLRALLEGSPNLRARLPNVLPAVERSLAAEGTNFWLVR
jgi:hypothetical protein